MKLITKEIERFVTKSFLSNGLVILFITNTITAITINENSDHDVKKDRLFWINKDISC